MSSSAASHMACRDACTSSRRRAKLASGGAAASGAAPRGEGHPGGASPDARSSAEARRSTDPGVAGGAGPRAECGVAGPAGRAASAGGSKVSLRRLPAGGGSAAARGESAPRSAAPAPERSVPPPGRGVFPSRWRPGWLAGGMMGCAQGRTSCLGLGARPPWGGGRGRNGGRCGRARADPDAGVRDVRACNAARNARPPTRRRREECNDAPEGVPPARIWGGPLAWGE